MDNNKSVLGKYETHLVIAGGILLVCPYVRLEFL